MVAVRLAMNQLQHTPTMTAFFLSIASVINAWLWHFNKLLGPLINTEKYLIGISSLHFLHRRARFTPKNQDTNSS